jgi:predicted NUDIX family phosphoesterase
MCEEVLVFRKDLFPNLPTDGFIHNIDFLPEILFRAEFMDRDKAELNPNYKQVISYCILRFENSVFRYKRSGWQKEARPPELFSIGVGGHINRSEIFPLWADLTPIVEWTRDRELGEEFSIESPGQPRLIGLLNYESEEVGSAHFGVIYEYWLKSPNVEPKQKRLHIQYGFVPTMDLIANEDEYENWSQIIITQFLNYEACAA